MLLQSTKRPALLAAAALFGFLVLAPCSPLLADTVNMAWSTVGDPGNTPDPNTGNQFGAVNHVYKIGTYDVTDAQYAAFLGSVAASDPYGAYGSGMLNVFTGNGIVQNGSPGSYTYTVAGNPNLPIVCASWGDAARFANWVQNGEPSGTEGPGTTETGAYTLNGATTAAQLLAVTRNPGATVFLPSQNEWYKAAYFDPTTGKYWAYPTQSSTPPINILSATGTNNANFYDYYNTGNGGDTDPVNYITPVGAFADSPGPFGTYDIGGDVDQWSDTAVSGASPGVAPLGGAWDNNSTPLSSIAFAEPFGYDPTSAEDDIGFRLARVPEPATWLLAATGAAGFGLIIRSGRCRRTGNSEPGM